MAVLKKKITNVARNAMLVTVKKIKKIKKIKQTNKQTKANVGKHHTLVFVFCFLIFSFTNM
jgi:hypothetical protein